MVKFLEVDPDEVDNVRESRRGRVSYPILKSFLETNMYVAKLDRTGMQQSMQALYSSLTAYIRNHVLPIKLFSRQNQIYLMRLDVDKEGNPIENWQEQVLGLNDPFAQALEITPEVVQKRFEEEKDKTTK